MGRYFMQIQPINYDAIKLDDYDVNIKNDKKTYSIFHRGCKKKTADDVLSTLTKIETVLSENFINIKQDNPKSILWNITRDLCHYYRLNLASIFDVLKKDPVKTKINNLQKCIENWIFPSRVFPTFNEDIYSVILDDFTNNQLKTFAGINRDARKHCFKAITKRAIEAGYVELPSVCKSWKFIQKLNVELVAFVSLTYYKPDTFTSPEEELKLIAHKSTEELFQLLKQNELYICYETLQNYIIKQHIAKPIIKEEHSDHIKKMALDVLQLINVSDKNAKILEVVLRKGVSPDTVLNIANKEKIVELNLLHIAALKGEGKVYNLLLKYGANPNVVASNGSSTMHFAAQGGNLEIFKSLLSKKNINAIGGGGNTALNIACFSGKDNIVEYLLENGAEIEIHNNLGDTPLLNASIHDNSKIIKQLLDRSAYVNVSNHQGATPLHCAVLLGSMDCTILLLKNGAELNKAEGHGCTPLHLAALQNHCCFIELFLEFGGDLNIVHKNGITPLIIAARNNNHDFAKLLLENGVKVNLIDAAGNSAIHYAIAGGNYSIVKLLLGYDADTNLQNYRGNLLLKLHLKEFPGIQKLLEDHLTKAHEI